MSAKVETMELVRVLQKEETAAILKLALALEEKYQDDSDWPGFLWHEVHAVPFALNRLVADRVLRIELQSRKYSYYRVLDIEKTKEALQLIGQLEPDAETIEALPEDLFDIIEGQDRIKNVLKLALAAPRPVHGLLVGPPATAKSLFLEELAFRLPSARYALGGTTSRAGIVDFLLKEPCRYLIIDEIDKADGRDLSALLSIMETGRISRLKKKMTELERRAVWVFAGANSDSRMPPELKSRFLRLYLHEYTSGEFKDVVCAVLIKREDIDAELARLIAQQIEPKSRDVRDAVRVARMSKGDRQEAERLIQELF